MAKQLHRHKLCHLQINNVRQKNGFIAAKFWQQIAFFYIK